MVRDRRDPFKFAISTPPMRYIVCECVPEEDKNRVAAVHKEGHFEDALAKLESLKIPMYVVRIEEA